MVKQTKPPSYTLLQHFFSGIWQCKQLSVLGYDRLSILVDSLLMIGVHRTVKEGFPRLLRRASAQAQNPA